MYTYIQAVTRLDGISAAPWAAEGSKEAAEAVAMLNGAAGQASASFPLSGGTTFPLVLSTCLHTYTYYIIYIYYILYVYIYIMECAWFICGMMGPPKLLHIFSDLLGCCAGSPWDSKCLDQRD